MISKEGCDVPFPAPPFLIPRSPRSSPSAHPNPALSARAQGSLSLSPAEGESDADFCSLGTDLSNPTILSTPPTSYTSISNITRYLHSPAFSIPASYTAYVLRVARAQSRPCSSPLSASSSPLHPQHSLLLASHAHRSPSSYPRKLVV